MFKNTALAAAMTSAFALLLVFSALVAVLTLAFKTLLLVAASLALYSLLAFVWRKLTGRNKQQCD